ncbi:MAG: hypothetical protein AAGU73_02345 [Actinomycetota bacterium]
MGPIIILDKSVFESLSWREHRELDDHFMENLTPILGMELLGDLAKQGRGTRTADELVTELSHKFGGGSGPCANVDFWQMCRASLMGAKVTMDGRICPQNMTTFPAEGGGCGALIDIAPINDAIMRWADGQFDEFERLVAGQWRQVTRSLDQESFERQLEGHAVILPTGASPTDVARRADYLLSKSCLQDVWLDWWLEQLALGASEERLVRRRWVAQRKGGFEKFAPYAAYCVRALFLLLVFTRNGIVKWLPTNLLDVQYLYYAPFCHVFSSNDNLHSVMAPHVLRQDQMFIPGTSLKSDLRRLADRRDALDEEELVGELFALGDRPPPHAESVVHQAWQRYMRPWSPSMANRASGLPVETQQKAIDRARQMFEEAEL